MIVKTEISVKQSNCTSF